MKQYFEFTEGTSSKFWEISLEGTTLTTRYGKIGTEGQNSEKQFSSEAEAQKEYDNLVMEMIMKGYEEINSPDLSLTKGKDYFEKLKGYTFFSCKISAKNVFIFFAQKEGIDDPLEPNSSALFFYNPDDNEKTKWGYRYFGESIGANICAVSQPDERWVTVTEDGEVHVTSSGDEGWEDPIGDTPLYFSNVKSIRNGHAYAIGPGRKVFKRIEASNWIQLDNGLFPDGEETDLEDAGFSDIDGFSENDIFACGDTGDLWHWNGSLWEKIELPENIQDHDLENICCAEDGFVYITTNWGTIICGKNNEWREIMQEITREVFETMVCYDGKVIISTITGLFFVNREGFTKADMNLPPMNSYAKIASNDGILLVAGYNEAAYFDGKQWTRIV